MSKTFTIASFTLLIAIAFATNARGAGLAVDSGLWKVTSSGQRAGGPLPPSVQTQCFTQKELDDPDTAFGQPPSANGETCKRTAFHQTATSVSWRFECTGQAVVASEGNVNFDSRTHYKGTVKTTGNVMGQPLNDTLQMEGQRVGPCTSNAAAP